MYLKSLVLRGFKSFADKSVLSLEPGITAVVGPNGSGKSNISDAVLWVLGERSAKNLRGHSMEDIIFSGSAARNAVSVAEVELVLDNSDGTLPVEFDEVSIARRMYRSGESEYLVNGALSRRLDVLDILYDSGLGAGTHSIISQGNLDAILQSKPEDRRALIEEAAGVLKHKQRKEKSERKLAALENHLNRVRDVVAEVERQLGPLERKAKRAEAYKVAKTQLDDLKLALAVDDLRVLQRTWGRVQEEQAAATAELEVRRAAVREAETLVNEVQEAMRRESLDAGDATRLQRRVASVSERLDGCGLVLRERRRSASDRIDGARRSLDRVARNSGQAGDALADALRQRDEVSRLHAESTSNLERATSEVRARGEARNGLDQKRAETERLLKDLDRSIDAAKRDLDSIRASVSDGMAHERIVAARLDELALETERARADLTRCADERKEADEKLARLKKAEQDAQSELASKLSALEEARSARDAARERVRVLESETKAIEATRKTRQSQKPVLEWLVSHSQVYGGSPMPIVRGLKVSSSLEAIVERLLGDAVEALAIDGADSALSAARAIEAEHVAGEATLVLRNDTGRRTGAPARHSHVGSALVDALSGSDEALAIAEALLGDVVLCETRDEAFLGHASDDLGLCFVSTDGVAVMPNGSVRIYGLGDADDEGALALERRSETLAEELVKARLDENAKTSEAEAYDGAYREAQARSLKASQDLAAHKGLSAAARTDEERAQRKLSSVLSEREDAARQLETARASVDELKPKLEEVHDRLSSLQASREGALEARDALDEQAGPVRHEFEVANAALNDAKLAEATLKERLVYAERMVIAREADVRDIERQARSSRRVLAEKSIVVQRAESVERTLEALAASVHRALKELDERVEATQEATDNTHARAEQARARARVAREGLDGANERMTQVKVEASKLEMQVDAAVKHIVSDCGTTLAQAELMPALEDRRTVEDELFKVERRIRNMGAINPEAAEEYAALKQRYDFMASQLSDMETARRSIERIVRVVEARMKDDFVRTFDEVNRNFSDIFSMLFPGGSASLALEDPENVETSGVEVTAQPKGKRLTKMMLMSGGEKSLTALALLFAVYRTRATPFYILDEVEAALDDTNLRRLASYIGSLRDTTQFIMITHQRRTMEMADVLFGVSMQADGVTKVVSQKLEHALEQAE